MNKGMKKVLVSAMALSLIVPAVNVPEVKAAAKPKLNAKSVTVTVGKTKKVTVKNVTAKKIKKTAWTIAKKNIAKLSAKKKNSVTVKGLKAGKTTLTAKVKVGKKTYSLKSTINVKKKSDPTPTNTPVGSSEPMETKKPDDPTDSAAPTKQPTPAPSVRDLTPVAVAEVPKKDADSFPSTPPQTVVDEATKVVYEADFENIELGKKAEGVLSNGEITGEGIEGFYLRGHGKDDDGGVGTSKDYLEVVDGENLRTTGNNTHVLHCHRETKTWQGPMIDLTSKLEEGCTYELTANVYSENTDLWLSYQEKTVKEIADHYGQFGVNNVETKFGKGKWNEVKVDISVPDDKLSYAVYFESFNGVGNDDIYVDNIKLTKVFQVKPDKTISKLKETYKDVFPIVGVGAGMASILGENGSGFIADQFNAYTPGNEMKPDAIMGSTPGKIVKPDEEEKDNTDFLTLEDAKSIGYIIPDDYANYEDNKYKDVVAVPRLKFAGVDAIMKACHEKGVKLRGHTLVWHQQTPVFFFQQNYKATKSTKYNVSRDCMDSRLEFYIKTVLEHILTSPYADCLYGYDVVNEYLHSRNAEKDGKYPSYYGLIYDTYDDSVEDHKVTLFPSYLKDSFTWAHEMLVKHNRTDVKLFYNDYNCYQNPKNIIHLTDYINSDGKVCDGIGMQAHLDITDRFHSPQSFAAALELFRVNSPELEIQITELDAGMRSTEANPLKDEDQAAYYDQLMNAILTNKKKGGNITGLILWSLYDGVSWRAQNYPCIFNGLYMPKSAFYAVTDAKKAYWD